MDFYVDVSGDVYPTLGSLDEIQRDIKSIFEDPSFGTVDRFTEQRKDALNQHFRKYLWESLPSELQTKVGYPTVVLNEDGTYTFKFFLRTSI